MGIAGFYLWLQRLYGDCITDVPQDIVDEAIRLIEKRRAREGDESAKGRDDSPSGPEPDKKKRKKKKKEESYGPYQENDNFYVDMNGLIHPCCHDTHPLPEPETEEEMLERCFDQLDLLVRVVRPRKCLVLCVDGVAPRSKMNQQRSRRFRAAEERLESDAIAAECADEIVQRFKVPRPRVRERWDSNAITPSTAFMERVGTALRWFVLKKLNEDPVWSGLTVTFSDAHVPGEGEHKIMQYIRCLRSSEGYDPSTTHIIHGMDADLICLGLATHESHVRILRNQLTETFQPDHFRFTYFDLEKYRHCLTRDFGNLGNVNFERVLDDFVFLCFFVGNDFLPHVPLISIKTKGIELLLDHYVLNFKKHHYLTKGGEVKFNRLSLFLSSFMQQKSRQLQQEYRGVERAKERAKKNVEDRVQESEMEMESVAETLAALPEEPESPNNGSPTGGSSHHELSDLLFSLLTSIRKERTRLVADVQPLTFSYLSHNYRREYYYSKFGWVEAEEEAARNNPQAFQQQVDACCGEYLRGMQWVMRYYTVGCPSWEWFYPYHYAPLLEDLAHFTGPVNVKMELGAPLHPVQQLLAVLPRLSVYALPEELHDAVKDPTSPLAKFYPDAIDVDLSEANFSYQGVLRIPFVKCEEMREACARLVNLQDDVGRTLVLWHTSHPLTEAMREKLESERKPVEEQPNEAPPHSLVPIPPEVTHMVPIAGFLSPSDTVCRPGETIPCPDEGLVAAGSPYCKPIANNKVHCYLYTPLPNTKYEPQLLHSMPRGESLRRHRTREYYPPPPPPPSAEQQRQHGAPRYERKRRREPHAFPSGYGFPGQENHVAAAPSYVHAPGILAPNGLFPPHPMPMGWEAPSGYDPHPPPQRYNRGEYHTSYPVPPHHTHYSDPPTHPPVYNCPPPTAPPYPSSAPPPPEYSAPANGSSVAPYPSIKALEAKQLLNTLRRQSLR